MWYLLSVLWCSVSGLPVSLVGMAPTGPDTVALGLVGRAQGNNLDLTTNSRQSWSCYWAQYILVARSDQRMWLWWSSARSSTRVMRRTFSSGPSPDFFLPPPLLWGRDSISLVITGSFCYTYIWQGVYHWVLLTRISLKIQIGEMFLEEVSQLNGNGAALVIS